MTERFEEDRQLGPFEIDPDMLAREAVIYDTWMLARQCLSDTRESHTFSPRALALQAAWAEMTNDGPAILSPGVRGAAMMVRRRDESIALVCTEAGEESSVQQTVVQLHYSQAVSTEREDVTLPEVNSPLKRNLAQAWRDLILIEDAYLDVRSSEK